MSCRQVLVRWRDEDSAFIADVPELPGCMAHGDTQDEALANAREAMRLWQDTAHEFGDPVPVHKGIETVAKLSGISL